MKLRSFSCFAVALLSTSFAAVAFASGKKTTTPSNTLKGSSPKTGTLVAMSGSGSLSGSSSDRGAYVGVEILPFEYQNFKTTTGNVTVETPVTTINTMPKTLEFYGRSGNITIRPGLSLENGTPSHIGVGFELGSNLEVGGSVSPERRTEKGQNKTETVSSFWMVGPQAYFFTEAAGLPLEVEGRVLLISQTSETINDTVTTKNLDKSGYVIEGGARVVKEIGSGLEYFVGAGLGYTSVTDKTDKNNEQTISGLVLKIMPAGVRFNF